ncbi:excinuclease ABC subunit UvrA [Pseudomonas rhizosphaerae]|uniref:excinuclease ABC subunit UvrA n=1 Tax=Pseudomonas rhizosphaerae TaxID=216142 RepID=UPI002B48C281|nr:excinuclease ABC subunit UvrA [Pseudomonas rhizosphaerae]MEB2869999.1 excinuclease ABC subunit UvrA [Pseudomonas rhizosphaerae]
MKPTAPSGFVQVRGAREHNLKNVDVDIPRDALVVFTGVSGSGKSSLAFGTLYAEAQRRYFESVAPYARRLIDQVGVPDVDSIEGLPPAVALQQQRGTPSTRSSVGSVTTLGSLVRMLYSRAGAYPPGQAMLYAEDFSPNTPQGACPHCHGLGRVYEVTEKTMVPDDSLTIRQRAVASWPPAWQGQNQRDILVTLGYDVDVPWRDLPKKQRDWILFTEETPTVPVYGGFTPAQTRDALKRKLEPSYQGTFTGARRYVLHTFTHSQSALMKKRVSQFMIGAACEVCAGKRLKREALSVTFAGLDIGEFSQLPLNQLAEKLKPVAEGKQVGKKLSEEKRLAAQQLAQNLLGRLHTLIDLGLGYLCLERSTPTLSSGELQRLRLATQLGSQLFGVVYVLDEPTAGLHPADGESLHAALQGLKAAGNSLFVVEHDLDTMGRADWVVDVGPLAGEQGGQVLYSGPPQGLAKIDASQTRAYLYGGAVPLPRPRRETARWLKLADVTRNNLHKVAADFPLQCFTAVTGISGSGKSSLVSQVLLELVGEHLGQAREEVEDVLEDVAPQTESGHIAEGMDSIKRLVQVDQKPIGRTPRSNLATYTGLFDHVRKLFAATADARRHGFDAGQFSFNVAKGRCPECEGEGFVSVELLFMPSVFSPCPTCHGERYSPKTLTVKWQGRTIAEVLQLTVAEACDVFAKQTAILRPLTVLRDIGLGYLRLGQPATELSGGEAQRIKLATELQRTQRGATLYVLDEPTTGLHPSDVDRLMQQLNHLVDAGNSVVVVEHDMRVVAQADWVIDIGPKAGDQGGKVVAAGRPEDVAKVSASRTAAYLQSALAETV